MESPDDLYWMIIGATIVFLLLLATIVSLIFIYQNRQIRNQLELKKVKSDFEQEILKAHLEIREQTLQNISQEIHDNVGQILSLANLQLTSIELEGHDPLKEKLDQVMTLISHSLDDLRNLSRTMDPENIGRARLTECLQFELDLLQRTGLYQTELEVNGTEQTVGTTQQLLIYRIVQEAINNIIKHARATSVYVLLFYQHDRVQVIVRDNGIGMNSMQKNLEGFAKGAGIRNMENRAKLMKGEFVIESAPSTGTSVCVSIPLSTPAHTELHVLR